MRGNEFDPVPGKYEPGGTLTYYEYSFIRVLELEPDNVIARTHACSDGGVPAQRAA